MAADRKQVFSVVLGGFLEAGGYSGALYFRDDESLLYFAVRIAVVSFLRLFFWWLLYERGICDVSVCSLLRALTFLKAGALRGCR